MSASRRYADAERYLQSLELFGMRFGLDRMRRLMTVLGSPLSGVPAVQVLGTNGKSSTARMIAAVLRAHGHRTGAYLSPHIISFAERIEMNGRAVDAEEFAAAVMRAAQAAELVERGLEEGDRVTQFEALTAAAFWAIARAEPEAGLGGRFDATSVISPRVAVLTNVGLEHTRWLGPTERHIAEEKLAVVPAGGMLVAGRLSADALEVAERVTGERGAELLLLGRDFELVQHERTFSVRAGGQSHDGLRLRALGDFQRVNFAVAIAAATALRGSLDPVLVARVAAELRLPGRLEPISEEPLVVVDGAHNPAAAAALAESLASAVGEREPVGVISVLDDKDAAGILRELLPLLRAVVFTRSSHPRALPPATLASLCGQLSGPAAEIVLDPVGALNRARELAGAQGAVLVTGSIYLLSDLARSRAFERAEAV